MSPFNVDQQFPTFKRIIPAVGRWSLRAAKKLCKFMLALILVFALVYVVSSLILGQLLKEDIAALKAKGEPTTMADLDGPKIPDSENGAVLYAKAFELMSTPQAEKDQDVISHFLTRPDREKDPSLWTKAGAAMPRCKEILRLAEEASSRPECRFPAEWENGIGALFTYSGKIRRLTELARANAVMNARNGRTEDALKSVRLSFRISESLKNDPFVSYYIRTTTTSAATRGIRDLLEYGSISESQARLLFDDLASIELGSGAVNAMRVERTMGIWTFDQVSSRRISINDLMGNAADTDLTIESRLIRMATRLRPVLFADERFYLQWMDDAVRYVSVPCREQKMLPPDWDFPPYAILTSILFPAYTRTRGAGDHADAHMAGVRTLLALAAYKDRFGSYPPSLDAVEKRLGWKLPNDPYSGKQLVYRQKGNGALLYSVGENLMDDGAQPVANIGDAPDGWDYRTAKGAFADIIWQMDH